MPSNNKGVVQTTIYQSFASVKPYGKISKCHKELSEATTSFLAKERMPLYTVSKESFVINNFSHVAIPQMYDTCAKTVSSELRQVDFYTSTTDLWSYN